MAVKKVAIYLDFDLLEAIRMKAATEDRSISEVIAEALRQVLIVDREDLRDAEARKNGPFVSYERVLKNLKKDGLI